MSRQRAAVATMALLSALAAAVAGRPAHAAVITTGHTGAGRRRRPALKFSDCFARSHGMWKIG